MEMKNPESKAKLLEEAILYCLIDRPASYYDIPVNFTKKYFSSENAKFYESLSQAILKGEKVDKILGQMKMDGHNPDWIILNNVQDAIPTNIAYYCKELMELRNKESFMLHLERAKSILKETGIVDALSYLQNTEEGKQALNEVLPETINCLIDDLGNECQEEIETGFPVIDKNIQLRLGNLLVIAALTNLGNTTLALNIAHNVAMRGSSVIFHSYEMTARELVVKLVARQTGKSITEILKYNGKKMEKVDGGSNLYINTESMELDKVLTITKRLASTTNLKLVVIDYLQLATPFFRSMTRAQEVGYVCRKFALLAKELKCLVILLSQLSRDADRDPEYRPRLKHLKESGEIENHADVVLFLHPHDEQTIELIPAKVRLGAGKGRKIFLKTDFKHGTFVDPTLQQKFL